MTGALVSVREFTDQRAIAACVRRDKDPAASRNGTFQDLLSTFRVTCPKCTNTRTCKKLRKDDAGGRETPGSDRASPLRVRTSCFGCFAFEPTEARNHKHDGDWKQRDQ